MQYEVAGGRVLWNGKPVAGAEAGRFRVLAPIVGTDGARVFVRGKVFAADAASFQVVNAGYACDAVTVWRIMETKLKPLKLEAASFAVIGPDHARDGRTVVYKDKRLALSKGRGPGDVRVLAGSLATDGAMLLHGSKREAETKGAGVDWSTVEARLLTADGDVNAPVAALLDGAGVWLFDKWSCQPACVRLDGAAYEDLQVVPSDVYRAGHRHVTDGNRIWYRGALVAGAQGAGAVVIMPNILTSGGVVWAGAERQPWAADKVAAGFQRDRGIGYLHTRDGLYSVDNRGQLNQRAERVADEAGEAELTACITALVQTAQTIRATLAIEPQWTGDVLRQMDPYRGTSLEPDKTLTVAPKPNLSARLEGAEIVVVGPGLPEPVRDLAVNWGRLAQTVALRLDGISGRYAPFTVLNGYPDGFEQHETLIRRNAQLFLSMISLLGERDVAAAGALLSSFWYAFRYRLPEDQAIYAGLAGIPLDVVRAAQYQDRPYGYLTQTRNLAGARYLLSSGLLQDPDWRVRLEKYQTLNGLIWATDVGDTMLFEVRDAWSDLVAGETHPVVVEHMAMILFTMIAKADQWLSRPRKGRDVTPVLRWALAEAVDWEILPGAMSARLSKMERAAG